MKILFSLFLCFFHIGLFTFGGGYAMLPLITRITQRKEWATHEEILNYYGIAQCTPGILAVNVAAFVGVKVKGVRGAAAAALGIITPSIIIITFIAMFLQGFSENETLQNVLKGMQLAACAVIAAAVARFCMKATDGVLTGLAAVAAFVFTAVFGVSPLLIAPAAGVSGALYAIINIKRKPASVKEEADEA